MQLTMSQIWSMATSMIGGRKDFSTSELSLYANLAKDEVATRIKHIPLESTYTYSALSGITTLSLPSDFGYATAFTAASTPGTNRGRQLDFKTREWQDSQATDSGEPETYAVYGNALWLWPSPNSDYSFILRYQGKIATMVSSSDTPSLDERWHVGIAYKTASLLASARNDLEGETVATARYLNYMQSTPTDDAYRQRVKGDMHVRFQKRAE